MKGQKYVRVDTQLTCNDILVDSTSVVDMTTIDDLDCMILEFDSVHDFGLAPKDIMPAVLAWSCEQQLISRASGHVRLRGITSWGREKATYHYIFQGYEIGEMNGEQDK